MHPTSLALPHPADLWQHRQLLCRDMQLNIQLCCPLGADAGLGRGLVQNSPQTLGWMGLLWSLPVNPA